MIQEEHLKQEKEALLKKLDLINHNLQKLKITRRYKKKLITY